MAKALVKFFFPYWRVAVYSDYAPTTPFYLRPEKFFRKSKAKELAKSIRFSA